MANAVAKILRDIEVGLSKKSTPVKRACSGGRASAAHTGSGSQIAVVSRAAWPPDLAASMGREVTMVYPIPFAP